MHAMMAHIPYIAKCYKSLKHFSGQALEKSMDNIKQIFRKKTNKVDPARETFVVRKRIETLHNEMSISGSRKRAYDKKDDHYWSTERAEQSARKRRRIQEEEDAVTVVEVIENILTEAPPVGARWSERVILRKKPEALKFDIVWITGTCRQAILFQQQILANHVAFGREIRMNDVPIDYIGFVY